MKNIFSWLVVLVPVFWVLSIANAQIVTDETIRPITKTEAYLAAKSALGDIANGQYVAQNCVSAPLVDISYEGFDVQRCTYSMGGRNAVIYVLNPTSNQILLWVSTACATVNQSKNSACGKKLVEHMRRSNSFIFPVAGDVLEPSESAGAHCGRKHPDKIVHVYFRDGITIESQNDYTCEIWTISEREADEEAFRRPKKVFNIARVAALHRNEYASYMGIKNPSDDEWRKIVRESYLKAFRSDEYSLLNIVAADFFPS